MTCPCSSNPIDLKNFPSKRATVVFPVPGLPRKIQLADMLSSVSIPCFLRSLTKSKYVIKSFKDCLRFFNPTRLSNSANNDGKEILSSEVL